MKLDELRTRKKIELLIRKLRSELNDKKEEVKNRDSGLFFTFEFSELNREILKNETLLNIEPLFGEALDILETFKLMLEMTEQIPQIIDLQSCIDSINEFQAKVEKA